MAEEEKNEGEIQIDLFRIFRLALHRWWILVICLVAGVLSGYFIGHTFKSTTYKTTATYIVDCNSGNDSLTEVYNEQSRIAALLGGCTTMLNQNSFHKVLADDLTEKGKNEEGMTYKSIPSHVSFSFTTGQTGVNSQNSSGNFIYVTTSASDKNLAYDLMISITDNLDSYITEKYQLASNASLAFTLANFIEEPVASVKDPGKIAALLGGVGLAALALLVLVIIDLSDKRVKSEDDLVENYQIPVLGCIPDFEDKNIGKEAYYHAYQHIETQEK